jgi:hypothetical protein
MTDLFHEFVLHIEPDMVWAGDAFLVAWGIHGGETDSEVCATRVGADGREIGTASCFWSTSGMMAGRPEMAWNGTVAGLLWNEIGPGTDGLYFQHISPAAEPIGSAFRVPGTSRPARQQIAWTGSEYGIAWSEQDDTSLDFMFSRIGFCE